MYCLKFVSIFKVLMVLGCMKQEVCVIPVRCKNCNAVFDLWYDLQEEGEVFLSTRKIVSESLCWKCRSQAISPPGNNIEDEVDEILFELD